MHRSPEGTPTRICFTANTAWNLAHFRLNHIKSVQQLGVEVHAAAPADEYVPVLEREGITFHDWQIKRRSVNPANELISVRRLAKIYRSIAPDLVHHYTVKAVLYGTAGARMCRVPAIVNAITGLPYMIVSEKSSKRGKLARWSAMKWYVWSVTGKNTCAVAQNNDDIQLLNQYSRQPLANTTLTSGSGVDLDYYLPQPPPDNSVPTILFVGRMLREKGIYELIDAIGMLRSSGQKFRFEICGSVDGGNRSSATKDECQQWVDEGLIDSVDRVDDVRPHLAAADVVVLPSYREGTPRSLLEAMAVGRPLVATDVPGCREVVEDGVNGLLVPPKDPRCLADALAYLLDSPERREQMGQASRDRAVDRFDERFVIQANLNVYRSMIPGRIPEEKVSQQVPVPAALSQRPQVPAGS